MNAKTLVAAMLAAFAWLFTFNVALADSCGSSHRADPPECVTWWYEGEYPYKRAYAKNNCPKEVSLKIDIKGGRDQLWTLSSGEEKRETYGKTIRAVKCCTQMSGGCDQLLATDSCSENWNMSAASDSCTAILTQGAGSDLCSIDAACKARDGSTKQNVFQLETKKVIYLNNCNGVLYAHSCD